MNKEAVMLIYSLLGIVAGMLFVAILYPRFGITSVTLGQIVIVATVMVGITRR